MNKSIRKANYKPLLFTTTMRNPERLKDFLGVLKQYDKQILTNEIIENVAQELIRKGLYRPVKVNTNIKEKWNLNIELEKKEVVKIFNDNPQSHKEAGFERGWQSRFDTWYKIAKELGFVYYWMGELIEFSESGQMLLDKEHPENEVLVFANAFAKYQRHNPFRRILNKNVPFILLIEIIELLKLNEQYNETGISRKEIPILLCWRDDNAMALYKTIKDLRKKHKFNPSDEIILEICQKLINNEGKVTKMDNNSILVDYIDDFIRKMRLTGLITIRGGGRFIDINTKEIKVLNFIKENYINYKEYQTEKSFFKYIGTIDKNLISKFSIHKTPTRSTTKELQKWINHYNWEMIKTEMLNLAENKSSKDKILKVISSPLRLEFLTSLAILNKLPYVKVKPNFISDDEGLPTSFAPGGTPDIECQENIDTILVEVTLLTGTQQHIRESFSIQRHLEDYIRQGKKAYSIFISPKAFIDTCRNATFIKFQYGLEVKILNIDLFIKQLEANNTLFSVANTANSCVD